MLTPAGLAAQIFVGPKDAKNVLARLKERLGKKSGIKGILI